MPIEIISDEHSPKDPTHKEEMTRIINTLNSCEKKICGNLELLYDFTKTGEPFHKHAEKFFIELTSILLGSINCLGIIKTYIDDDSPITEDIIKNISYTEKVIDSLIKTLIHNAIENRKLN